MKWVGSRIKSKFPVTFKEEPEKAREKKSEFLFSNDSLYVFGIFGDLAFENNPSRWLHVHTEQLSLRIRFLSLYLLQISNFLPIH